MGNVRCKKDICLLTNNINQCGGIERVISVLSKYFAENNGWNVTILSLYSQSISTSFDFVDDVEIIHGELEIEDDIKPYLCNIFSEKKYDVLFTFHPGIGLEYLRIKKKFPNLYWIATEHSSPYDYTWKRKLLNLLTYHGANKLIVLTESAKSYYKRRMIFQTQLIPNPLPFEMEQCSDCSSKKIIAVGRLEQVKQFDLLIEAFSKIAQNYPEWTLDLLGDGTQREHLQLLVEKYGLQKKVNFLGMQKDVKKYMLDAAFMVISSEYEGFSLVTLEGFECGLPVVAFELPSIKEIVGDYKAAFFAQQKSVKELAEKMQEMMESPDIIRTMGKAAKQCVAQYSILEIGKKWDELIRENIN